MPSNILIIRFSSIGDLLLTTPLVRAIRARHPDSRITFVVREDMADTIRHNKRIDEVVTFRRGESLRDLASQLREQDWTHRLDLHCSLRSYQLRRMIGGQWRGYSKHRIRRKLIIMSHGSIGGSLGPVAERYFAAARDLDVTPDGGPPEFFSSADGEARAAAILAEHQLGAHRPLVVLAPGAAHFTKRWPEYHWVDLVQKIGANRDFLILGGKAEETMAAAIADAAKGDGRAVSIAGRVNHDVNGALLRRAELLISGDTGLLHLASAVGTRAVGIYGPTVEAFGFFPYHANFTAVQHDISCRPCSSQGTTKCPKGHHSCLVGITADEVIAALGI